MNRAGVEAVADAILYEGYMLYPYRRSALKNRERWTFGVIRSRADSSARGGLEPWCLQCECLVTGGPTTQIEANLRFLVPSSPASSRGEDARACEVPIAPTRLEAVEERALLTPFSRGHAGQRRVEGRTELAVTRVAPNVYKLMVRVMNLTPADAGDLPEADGMQFRSMVSTHVVVSLRDGEFVPPRDPPPSLIVAADGCRNLGLWPILMGEPGARDLVLCSPIILDDYPQVAPESPGNLFDGTEIEEILTLRILTLTPDERREIATGDARARALLARTEGLGPDQLARLHGAMRAAMSASEPPRALRVGDRELGPGDRVRLCPGKRSDILDIALAGRLATIVSVEQDFDDRSYFAVTVDDDPGRDLGALGKPGHRFYFTPDEVELVPSEHGA